MRCGVTRSPADSRALRPDAVACRPGRSVGSEVQRCAAASTLLRDEALCSADGTGSPQQSRRAPCCGLHCHQLPGNKLVGRTRGHGRASCTRGGVDRGGLGARPAHAAEALTPTAACSAAWSAFSPSFQNILE